MSRIASRHADPSKNWIFLILCVTSISLDPLFLYIPVINDEIRCLRLEKKLGITASVLRWVIDLIYISFKLRTDFSDSYGEGRSIARKFLYFYALDFLAILPLPQAVIIIFFATKGDSYFLNPMKLLRYVVFSQFVPRAIRIYPLIRKVTRSFGILAEARWAKAAFNLLLYMLSGHACGLFIDTISLLDTIKILSYILVLGALWYFFAIERGIICWKKSCIKQTGCNHHSFDCRTISENYRFLNDFCSAKAQNTMVYDFGIFQDAIQTGVVERTDFFQKFLYCYRWGLQSLSCFGQNLVTSIDIWENIFTISITISSVVLFVFLIGNMQLYLQSQTTRSEEMKLKMREIEQWMHFKKLSENLQRQLKQYQQHVWRETKGIDVENVLNNLPRHFRRKIKRELCLEIIKRVPMFEKMDELLLDAMCDCLKPVLYTEENYIVREGDQVDEMLFIMRGRLSSVTTNGGRTGFFNSVYLGAGDFCGEELLTWVLDPQSSSNLPISTRTVRALSEVEAFALMADDLKFVVTQFWRLHRKEIQHTFRFYSQQWRSWAACFIQAAWRRHSKKKLEESLLAEENRLQDALANASGSSPSLGATIYAARFAVNTLRAIRRRRTGKARSPERVPPMVLQKPAEPDLQPRKNGVTLWSDLCCKLGFVDFVVE